MLPNQKSLMTMPTIGEHPDKYPDTTLVGNRISGPIFVISLDFELIWGVRDHATRESYGANVIGARQAIPRILGLFEEFGIHATWATVGFLFAESRDELMHFLPIEDLRPAYAHAPLSNYSYLHEVGDSEKDDPFAFAPSLIARIAKTPGQEIATHTMSHYYCLEFGQSDDSFRADLAAAKAIAGARGIELKSIVFPRNQYADRHLEISAEAGIEVYRGNARGSAYRPIAGTEQSNLRRALRLVDAYTGLLGAQVCDVQIHADRVNVPASMFLRPVAGRLGFIHPLHLAQIKAQMSQAARAGRMFHLWWHPHNFGERIEENISGLRAILSHFAQLRDTFGMQSLSMEDAA